MPALHLCNMLGESTMTDYFKITLPEDDINAISNLGLAHLGDAVFEIMVRTWMCEHGYAKSSNLHKMTVQRVSAPAQAKAVEIILPSLTDRENAVYKRGRNTRVNSVPHRATIGEYHAATGLETLFGWLYLHGETERLNELFALIMKEEV